MKTKPKKNKNNKEFEEIEEQNEDLNPEESDSEDEILEVDKQVKIDYKSVIADDSVKIYLQQIGKIPLLSYEEEMAVAREIKENNSTKA